jgi:hypothetical protein
MKHEKLIREIERREQQNQMAPFPMHDTEVINDLKILNMMTAKEGYEQEPVTYCKTCMSIHIKTIEFEDGPEGEERYVDYCVPCGNTDLDKVYLAEWEELYAEKYGDKFLTKNNK